MSEAARRRPPTQVAAYGLSLPTVEDLRQALERGYAADAARVWAQLLNSAGPPRTDEDDTEALRRMLAVMKKSQDPVVALCAKSMAIRLASFANLSAAHAAVRRLRS